MGYSPWGRKNSDMTEPFHFTSLPHPGIEPTSPHLLHWKVDSLPLSHLQSPYFSLLLQNSGVGIKKLPLYYGIKRVPFGMGHQGKKVTNKSVSLLGLRSRNCETVRSRKCLHILSTSPADSSTRLSTYMSVSYICSYFGVNRCININY